MENNTTTQIRLNCRPEFIQECVNKWWAETEKGYKERLALEEKGEQAPDNLPTKIDAGYVQDVHTLVSVVLSSIRIVKQEGKR